MENVCVPIEIMKLKVKIINYVEDVLINVWHVIEEQYVNLVIYKKCAYFFKMNVFVDRHILMMEKMKNAKNVFIPAIHVHGNSK